jgi:hypothetical protein
MVCVRRAWLTLGALTVQLHDETAGYYVTELDLGSPEVRDVTNSRPDAHGIDDRTRYFGGRVVSVEVTALASAGARIDEVAGLFAPFMVPSVRPDLHYVLDRAGLPERVLSVRAQDYSFAVNDTEQRDVQLSWVAADPVARDPTEQTATAWAGSDGGTQGRAYNLRYNRVYPAAASAPVAGAILSAGDVPVRPLLRVYGPITNGSVTFTEGATAHGGIGFLTSYVIGSGHFVEVDCDARTAYLDGDRSKSVLTSLDWPEIASYGGWPEIPPRTSVVMHLMGSSTTGATQCVATWQDGYLT